MATNKAKRTIHLAQAQPQPARRSTNPQPATGLMPVKSNIYRTLAEMNAGFDKVIHELGNLRHVDFLRSPVLSAMHGQLSVIRAQANREFLNVLGERETANAGHFERLCTERGITPPPGS